MTLIDEIKFNNLVLYFIRYVIDFVEILAFEINSTRYEWKQSL